MLSQTLSFKYSNHNKNVSQIHIKEQEHIKEKNKEENVAKQRHYKINVNISSVQRQTMLKVEPEQ